MAKTISRTKKPNPLGFRHGDLHAALVAAALAGLDASGEIPSWRALARTCAVSHTAPYRHFESVAALQSAVRAECFNRFVEYARAALDPAPDPFERLAIAIRRYVEYAKAHPSRYALMFGRAVDVERFPESALAGKQAFVVLVGVVTDCGARDPVKEAYLLWTAHHGLADALRLGYTLSDAHSPDEALESLVQMSVDYLRSTVSREQATAKAVKRVRR
jgi:AcrR family transcriptional regulator